MDDDRCEWPRGRNNAHDGREWRRWSALVATVWIQAVTGTNFDFSAYSSALKSSLGVSQQSLNYLATASDLGKAFGWSSGLAVLYMPLPAVLLLSAALGLAAYAVQYCVLLSSPSSPPIPYPANHVEEQKDSTCPISSSCSWRRLSKGKLILRLVMMIKCHSKEESECALLLARDILWRGDPPASLLLIYKVFLVCLVAGCSICWFNTVCFVVCTRSFPTSGRPLALSLSTSFNGLSAAFYTLFANALAPYTPSMYLLLNAILPLAVSLLTLPVILLCRQQDSHNLHSVPEHDERVFLGFYLLAVVTGIYLVILGSFTSTGSTAWVVLSGAMALLALPLIIPAASCCSDVDTHGPEDPAMQLNHDDPQKPLLISNAQYESEYQLQGCCSGTILEKSRVLVLGKEHSAKMLLQCVDFWLYYTAYFCGATVGLVYSNNLGQIAQSLNRQSELTMFLAIYSSCSFFGRLLSAVPEFLHRKVSFARTGWLAAALVPMPMAFFLMWKSQDENTLVAGTALIGLSSGFIFAAAVSVTSELFGPNSIGMNHNILITNIPLGSLLYGQIAALVYDANGLRKTVLNKDTGTVETMIVCMGASCYSTTFLVWGFITMLGLASSIVLFFRTRQAYAAGQSSFKHRSQVSS